MTIAVQQCLLWTTSQHSSCCQHRNTPGSLVFQLLTMALPTLASSLFNTDKTSVTTRTPNPFSANKHCFFSSFLYLSTGWNCLLIFTHNYYRRSCGRSGWQWLCNDPPLQCWYRCQGCWPSTSFDVSHEQPSSDPPASSGNKRIPISFKRPSRKREFCNGFWNPIEALIDRRLTDRLPNEQSKPNPSGGNRKQVTKAVQLMVVRFLQTTVRRRWSVL